MSTVFWAGVDIGGTKCAVTLARPTDGLPDIVERTAFPTPPGPGPALAALTEALCGLLARHPEGRLVAIGISCGGPLDSRQGLVLGPPNLPGWDRVPVTEAFEAAFHVPAALCNDANAGALAEGLWGEGRGEDPFVFLTFGTGMGAGVLVGGRLLTGRNDMAAEVGHLRLTTTGPVGYGKQGSFEGWCSGGGIARQARARALKAIREGRPPSFCPTESDLPKVDARLVADAARRGDPLARAVWRTTGRMLGRGLAMIVDTLNPACIAIGSLYGRCRDLLEKPMRAALAAEALPQSLAVCRIVPAGLGEKVGDYAALAVVAQGMEQPRGGAGSP